MTKIQFYKELQHLKNALENLEWALRRNYNGQHVIGYMIESAYQLGRMEIIWNKLDGDTQYLISSDYAVERDRYRSLEEQVISSVKDK